MSWRVLCLTIAVTWVSCSNAAEPATLRVLCYNIHYGQGTDQRYDLERLAKVIKEAKPDLVALQEVDVGVKRSGQVHQARRLGELTGMAVRFGPTQHYEGGLFGNAVLTRLPIRDVAIHPLPYTEATPDRVTYPRGAIAVTVRMPNGQSLRFVSTHFQHNVEEDRLQEAQAINKLFAKDDELPTILAGDMNAKPDSEPIQELLKHWTNASDKDAAPTAPSRKPRSRIDYIFYRPSDAFQLVEAKVIEESEASDHRPVLAVFKLTAEAKTVSGTLRIGVRRIELLPPGPKNPRNSEGDFIRLQDGRVLLVYTHFTDGSGDHAEAYLAGRFSLDDGKSWSDQDVVILPNDGGQNVMSVSLLRLNDGRIALFHLRKNSLSDCRPVMRISSDEAKTWSEPIEIIPENEIGYYVLNNDRVIQLENGRLVIPLAQHHGNDWEKWTPYGKIVCYVSDDAGKTWKRGQAAPEPDRMTGKRVMLQEPGVVALKDGRLMLWCRTDAGRQYVAYSQDQGKSWTRPKPSSIHSPRSPASIERIPLTGDLLLVWNDHRNISANLRGKRTPLCAAVSSDEGRTWRNVRILENNPHGWYCYTAIAFAQEHILLAHSAGDRRKNNGLASTQVTRFPVKWVYREP